MIRAVNVFESPYEKWAEEIAGDTEIEKSISAGVPLSDAFYTKGPLLARVQNYREAASYALLNPADIALDNHVFDALKSNASFDDLLRSMPSRTPMALNEYSNRYPPTDLAAVDEAISTHGICLAEGQELFHGGYWDINLDELFVTDRPLSTTFSPLVALRNAEYRGKAYSSPELHLLVLRVTNARTPAFVFNRRGKQKIEKEIVFRSGAQIRLVSKEPICRYTVSTSECMHNIKVNAYVLRVDIS